MKPTRLPVQDLPEDLQAELAVLPAALWAELAEALRHARRKRLQEVTVTIEVPIGTRPWDWQIGYAGRGRRRVAEQEPLTE